jgi:hypothetical protein
MRPSETDRLYLEEITASRYPVAMDEQPPLRIDITGVGQPTAPEEVGPAPDDLTAIATQMAAGTEPAGATPMSLAEFATSAADVPAGLLKGVVQGSIGLPGDIISLVRGVYDLGRSGGDVNAFLGGLEKATGLPTTEDVKKFFDETLGIPLVPAGASERRREAAKIPEFVGELGGAGTTAIEGTKAAVRGINVGAMAVADRAVQAIMRDPNATAMGVLDQAGRLMPLSRIVQPGAPAAKPLTLTNLDQQRASVAEKIVNNGIAENMSPTKMIQAFEQQTGSKLTGKQQKELKEYVANAVPKGQIYSDQAFKDLVATPFPFEPSTQRFTQSFDDAMAWIKTLAPENLKSAALMADDRLAPILGVAKDGKVKRLLTTNGKLLKTETGVEGGVPIELPDGRNIESAGLAISPAFKVGKFSTCPNSASCAQECLGKTSGGYFAYGGGADLDAMKGTRLRSFRMTQAMFREPEAFAIKVHNEIVSLKTAAAKNGNALAIRLNVLSDIDPRVYKSIIEAHPDVMFYDYTKMKYRPVAPNHHYTYSSTGLSQKAGQNGLGADVDNPHSNWVQMRQWLDEGQNVAMAFSSKKALPESVVDEATGKIYKVIDGDAYDFRPMDAQPEGMDGVIVGLKNKAMTRKESMAAQDSNGFFVHYDPKLGTQVSIPRQKREAIMLRTGGEQSPILETGEQITERTTK